MIQQTMMMNPATLPVWLAGLWFLFAERGRRFRVLGWACLLLLGVMVVLHAKDYYLAPIYPMLFAAGGAAFEGWTSALASGPRTAWGPGGVVAFRHGARCGDCPPRPADPGAPTGLCCLPATPRSRPGKDRGRARGPAAPVVGRSVRVARTGVGDRADLQLAAPGRTCPTGIFASNYGEAGALNLFGPAHGLPPAICAHQTHSFWGPGDIDRDTLIWLQWGPEWLSDCAPLSRWSASTTTPGAWRRRTGRSSSAADCAPLAEQWPDLRTGTDSVKELPPTTRWWCRTRNRPRKFPSRTRRRRRPAWRRDSGDRCRRHTARTATSSRLRPGSRAGRRGGGRPRPHR